MKKHRKGLLMILAVCLLALILPGCGEKMSDAADHAKDVISDIKDTVAEAIDDAGEALGEAGGNISEVVSDIADQVGDAIGHNDPGEEEEPEAEEDDFIETPEEDLSGGADDTAEETRYVFRNRKLLQQHYEKHGIEMGFASAEEYEEAASAVINNPDALTKTEKEDGDYVFYVEETNDFVILSTDGYIRTYFWPSAGKKYFDRQ